MSKAKSVSKSIRLTEEVFTYIDGYQGEGFNQKFENIILNAMCTEQQRKKRIKELDKRIAEREEVLRKLFDDISSFEYLNREVNYITRQVDVMRKRVSQMNAAASDPGDLTEIHKEGD